MESSQIESLSALLETSMEQNLLLVEELKKERQARNDSVAVGESREPRRSRRQSLAIKVVKTPTASAVHRQFTN